MTDPARGGSGNGPERALEAITLAIARSAKADPPPSLPASAGPLPRSPTTATQPPHPQKSSTTGRYRNESATAPIVVIGATDPFGQSTSSARGGSGNGPERALEAITLAIARSAKADPPPSLPASAGPFPRSPKTHPHLRPALPIPSPNRFRTACLRSYCNGIRIVQSGPFCVNMSDRPRARRQRERAGASIGSDHPCHRAQRESRSSPELPCERRTVPAEPQDASTQAPRPA